MTLKYALVFVTLSLPVSWLFKAIARLTMPEKAWAYYSSASDDEITNRENHAAFHRSVFMLADWTRSVMGDFLLLQNLVQTANPA
jgi:hypothetical protein